MLRRRNPLLLIKQILNAELEPIRPLKQHFKVILPLLILLNPVKELPLQLYFIPLINFISVCFFVPLEHLTFFCVAEAIARVVYSRHIRINIHSFHLLLQCLVEMLHLILHVEVGYHLLQFLFIRLVLLQFVTHHLNS